ncbi:hypothetical protein [Hydrogenophaga sp. PAMC20947]|uniref:hypothetical protein n=1 Tax=Hydrogenophaga sp. PAMC20947 TaxID=2565558 RepID=UPI00109DEA21|nr:hypothetical protein [Hydrogenophaga sp. PAMC20947]QCB45684.1 hypothetical protein E5678_06405 [Hydrogenophaga sp. PAMC20947]
MNGFLTGVWRRAVRKYGPFGLVAVLFLLAALALAAWLPRLTRQNEAMRTEAQRLALETSTAAPARVIRQIPLGQQVGEFLDGFPTLGQSPADLRQVFRIAAEHHVTLPKGEYLFKNESNTPLLTVTMSLPITADYASIKAFSAELLESVPNASLDELRMTRNEAGSQVLESLVRFSFVYRKP